MRLIVLWLLHFFAWFFYIYVTSTAHQPISGSKSMRSKAEVNDCLSSRYKWYMYNVYLLLEKGSSTREYKRRGWHVGQCFGVGSCLREAGYDV